MKKHLLLLVSFFVTLSVTQGQVMDSTERAQLDSIKQNWQLLWRVKGHGNTAYLFGTMHLTSDRVFGFSDSVYAALMKSESVAFEIDMDDAVRTGIPFAGSRYRNFQGGFSKLKAGPPRVIDRMLDNDNYEHMGVFLDAHLYLIAKRQNKNVLGLEDYKAHMDIATQMMSTKREYNDTIPEPEISREDFIAIYEAGDLHKIDSVDNMFRNYDPFWDKILMHDRNLIMAEGMDSLLQHSSKSFVAVGAAHLPGEDGLIQLMKEKGYSVEPVEASFNPNMRQHIRKLLEKNESYTLKDTTEGFALTFPAKPAEMSLHGSDQKMYFFQEPGNKYSYFFFSTDANDFSKHNQELFFQIVAQMAGESGHAVKKWKEIHYKDVKGIECELKEGFWGGAKARIYLTEDRKLYFLMVEGGASDLDEDETKDFFKSFRLFDRSPRTSTWTTLSDSNLRFSIPIPQPYTKFTEKETPQYSWSEEDNLKDIYTYSAIDFDQKASYTIEISQTPLDYSSPSDEEYFSEAIKALEEEYNVSLDTVMNFTLPQGYAGREILLTSKNGTLVRTKIFQRGNKAYKLQGQIPANQHNAATWKKFFGEFELMKLEPQECKERLLFGGIASLKLPFELNIDTNDYSYDNHHFLPSVDTSLRGNQFDNQGNVAYWVGLHKINRHYYFDSVQSIFEYYDDYLWDTDSIYRNETFTVDGFQAKDIIWQGSDSSSFVRWIVIPLESEVFVTGGIFPIELKDSFWGDPVDVYGIKILNGGDPKGLANSKLVDVMEKIHSGDTTQRFGDLLGAISKLRLRKSELPTFYEYLKKPHYSDTLNYGSVRVKMVRLLKRIYDEKSVQVLKDLYQDSTSTQFLQQEILEVLTAQKTEESMEAFFALVPSFKNEKAYDILTPFFDTLEFVGNNYSKFLPMFHNPALEVKMTKLTQRTMEQGFLPNDSLGIYEREWAMTLDCFITALDSIKEGYELRYSNYYSVTLTMAELLSHPAIAKDNIAYFEKLTEMTDFKLRSIGVYGLLKAGRDVPESLMKEMCRDTRHNFFFLKKVYANGLMDKVEPHLGKNTIIESQMRSHFEDSYYWGEIKSMEFVKRVKAKIDGETVRLNLYRVKRSLDGPWYPAYVYFSTKDHNPEGVESKFYFGFENKDLSPKDLEKMIKRDLKEKEDNLQAFEQVF